MNHPITGEPQIRSSERRSRIYCSCGGREGITRIEWYGYGRSVRLARRVIYVWCEECGATLDEVVSEERGE